MSSIRIDEQVLDFYKRSLARAIPVVKATHRLEAFAKGFGFDTYAALASARKEAGTASVDQCFSVEAFRLRLDELKYGDLGLSVETIADLFSYRTFVALKNGYGYETVRSLAMRSGRSADVATIYAEMLCAHPLSEHRDMVLSETDALFILKSVPEVPLAAYGLSMPEIDSVSIEPYDEHFGAALAMRSISKWRVEVSNGKVWAAVPIGDVWKFNANGVGVTFRVAESGLRLLRNLQKKLDKAEI